MSNNVPPEQPTKESLLSLLGSEIDALQSKDSRSGWSLWAILASIMGTLWLLTEETKGATFHFANVAKIFIAGVAFVDFFSWLHRRLTSTAEASDETRFYWLGSIAAGKSLWLIVEFLRSVLLILLAYNIQLGWYFFIPLAVTYTFYSLISFGGLIGPIIAPRFPLSPNIPKQIGAKIGYHGAWFLLLVPLAIALFFLIRACPAPVGEALSDYRIGGLLVVAMILLNLLISVLTPSSELLSLSEIRRKLVFNRTNLNDAILQTEIALRGMTAVDALRDTFINISILIDRMDEQVANTEISQKTLEDVFSNAKGGSLTSEQVDAVTSIQLAIKNNLATRETFFHQAGEQFKDFDDKAKWILRGRPGELQTIQQMYLLRQVRAESSDKRFYALLDKQEAIEGEFAKFEHPKVTPKKIQD